MRKGAAVRLFLADQHAEQGGFAGAVGADHADDAALGVEVEARRSAAGRRSLSRNWVASTTRSPSRGPGMGSAGPGLVALLVKFLRFQFLSGPAGLALGVAALGVWRTHSSSAFMALVWAVSCFSSISRRFSF